ncbi:hypothetical protein [Spiroplasma eriocheiris]|uniref:AAA domain-containing protein n=1 Tax=Spiroplasma eriocheiris TaxID=315358 RepID=A0A0H3XGV2_9MOLU|nr:hypothetical protein [Spiroplasma eriocheiris]AHF57272.1 hypothetical protein SPE_0138 [Spiroplasma eriocheiris CCTCC M 207170]AKM53733.1 hypothetical protein SERIO_v1c01380 [Spiroplasma eriocheiris]
MEYNTITFKNSNKELETIKLYQNKLVIFGNNNSGKTKLLNTLSNGFLGKDSSFRFNDNSIGYGDYQIIYLKEKTDLVEEIKLTKTSIFRNKLIKSMNELILSNNKYEELTTLLTNLNNVFNEMLLETDILSNQVSIKSQLFLKSNFSNLSLEGIIDKLLKFDIYDFENTVIDPTKYSSYQLRILLLNILIKYTDMNDKLRPLVFIIDQPEMYSSTKSLWDFLNNLKLLLNDKSIIILATNAPIVYNFIVDDISQVYFLRNNKLISVDNIDKIIMQTIAIYAFLDSDSNDYEVFIKELSYVILEEDIIYEKNKYLKSTILLLLHVVEWEKLNMKISRNNTIWIDNNNNNNIYLEQTIDDFIFSYLFLKSLRINIIVDDRTKSFFDKCYWLFN